MHSWGSWNWPGFDSRWHTLQRLASEADSLLSSTGLPTLVLLGGADQIGASAWPAAENAAGVEVRSYPSARHDLFHDVAREEVMKDLCEWLDSTA